MLAVDCHALGLAVSFYRTVRQDGRTLVPVHAEPFHAVDDDADGLVGGPRLVRVLDAEDEGPLVMAGEEPVEEGGADPADMQSAGGAWREPYANGIHVLIMLLKEGDVIRALLYSKGEGGKREKRVP